MNKKYRVIIYSGAAWYSTDWTEIYIGDIDEDGYCEDHPCQPGIFSSLSEALEGARVQSLDREVCGVIPELDSYERDVYPDFAEPELIYINGVRYEKSVIGNHNRKGE